MIVDGAELARVESAGTLTGHTGADRYLSDGTRRRILEAVPANTFRAYGRQWSAFTAWCAENGRAPSRRPPRRWPST